MSNPELDLEIIANQATINIGTIGHVAHGKSTLTEALSGIKPVKFKEEKERNITIHLGYANAKIYKCDTCPRPDCYRATGSHEKQTKFICRNLNCQGTMHLIRHISIVDCPGHDALMATMVNGASIMDGAIMVIGGDQKCPQPQTLEHLAAAEIMQLKHILIVQNKVDLLKPSAAHENHDQIKSFVEGTVAESSPITPMSAIQKYNLDVLCEYLITKIPHPIRDLASPGRLIVVRSFDVNKAGPLDSIEDIDKLKGGVVGGTILQGMLRVGDELEIKPGLMKNLPDGTIQCISLKTRVISLFAERNSLTYAVPGGLIGVGTLLDPFLTRRDRMKGQVVGHVGTLPDNLIGMEISYNLMRRMVGTEETSTDASSPIKVKKLETKEILQINIGSIATQGQVQALREVEVKPDEKDTQRTTKSTKVYMAKIRLNRPVCSPEGEKISLSRKIDGKWRLIGWGRIEKGIVLKA
jgi:translation initiation factor 2 subunit 3